jgi:hypothetical protein
MFINKNSSALGRLTIGFWLIRTRCLDFRVLKVGHTQIQSIFHEKKQEIKDFRQDCPADGHPSFGAFHTILTNFKFHHNCKKKGEKHYHHHLCIKGLLLTLKT